MTAPVDRSERGSDSPSSAQRRPPSSFLQRTATAAVLAPVVLAITYVGGWPFFILCAAAAAGILWEWTRLVSGRFDARILISGWAALFAALLLTGSGYVKAAAAMIGVGAIVAAGVSVGGDRAGRSARARWAFAGVLYAGAAFIGPALLRRDPLLGWSAVLFLIAIVWGTDILAYLTGRAVGGPLLWPSISPKKTWSGAAGGLAGGVAAGVSVAYASGLADLVTLAAVALLLSCAAQVGDLLESAIKRRFDAKDTSQLIPGHGGLMDRLDGFLVAALAALLIGMLRHGTDAPGQGLLLW